MLGYFLLTWVSLFTIPKIEAYNIKFYQGENYKLHEWTSLYIGKFSMGKCNKFDQGGKLKLKVCHRKIVILWAALYLLWSIFWGKHRLKYCEMSLERGKSDTSGKQNNLCLSCFFEPNQSCGIMSNFFLQICCWLLGLRFTKHDFFRWDLPSRG